MLAFKPSCSVLSRLLGEPSPLEDGETGRREGGREGGKEQQDLEDIGDGRLVPRSVTVHVAGTLGRAVLQEPRALLLIPLRQVTLISADRRHMTGPKDTLPGRLCIPPK